MTMEKALIHGSRNAADVPATGVCLESHERAKRIGARLEVWSEVAAGTEVELSIPGSIAYEAFSVRRRPPAFPQEEGTEP